MSALPELMNYTLVSKYARWIAKEKRRETWKEAVYRVRDMMLEFYNDKGIDEEINWAYDMMLKKKVLGSQRALQFGGTPALKKNARIYNCVSSYCDRPRFFQECFWLLLCGCGTGFSVQKQHVDRLPGFRREILSHQETFVVPDTIEGWADTIGVLLSNHLDVVIDPAYEKYAKCGEVVFDYSQIRPAGSFLSSGVGKAPGPNGLRSAIIRIDALLRRCRYQEGRKRLRPIDCYDIVMHISDAVLSGGVRRCIAQDEKVLIKEQGYKDIQDVTIGDYVSTPNGWKRVINTFSQGKQNCVTIKHQNGTIKCTPNHRVAVLNSYDGQFTWKYAKNLTDDDYLYSIRRADNHNNTTRLPSFKYIKPARSTTCKNIVIPPLDEKMAWFLGIFHGDGYVKLTHNSGALSVAVAEEHKQQAVDVAQQLTRFGVNVTVQHRPHEDHYYRVRVKSKQLATYFHTHIKQPNTPINIPDFVKKASVNIRMAYIQGVVDADGSVKVKPFCVTCTIYEDFAKQLQSLLLSCGIISRIQLKAVSTWKCNQGKPNWKDQYHVSILNKLDLQQYIEFVSKYRFATKIPRITHDKKTSNCFPAKWFSKPYPKGLRHSWSTNNKRMTGWVADKYYHNQHIVPIRVLSIEQNNAIDTYDIEVEQESCFLCNGILVHNSSTICLFSADDHEMMTAKTGNWKEENGQRARSNNSVMLLRNKTTKEEFLAILEHVKEHGEPGFIWTDDLEMLINPCAEIGMWAYYIVDQAKYDKYMETYDGMGYKALPTEMGLESGWQGCNLSTINCATIKDIADFNERGRAAAIIGTLQAGFTRLEYLTSWSQAIFQREALLGVSMTGAMENFDIVLNPTNQRTVAKTIVDTNKAFAKIIGVNQAARTTCMKPEGTSSCLLGTSSSLHPHHSKRYLRILQANRAENPYQHFRATNQQACTRSVWSANDTDDIIIFPIEVPDGAKTKNQMPALALLDIVKSTQGNWVNSGKNKKLCTQSWLSHNVSNTITVTPTEWVEVADFIYKNKRYFCGVALLPQSGDKDYAQAPFTAVYTAREIVREYGDAALWTSGLIEIALDACDNLWKACDITLYDKLNTKISTNGGGDSAFWMKIAKQCAMVEKMNKFAIKYFDGDLKRLTYCMKDVYNWKLYCDLVDSIKPVDYTTMIEEQDETQPEQEIACAGGACILV